MATYINKDGVIGQTNAQDILILKCSNYLSLSKVKERSNTAVSRIPGSYYQSVRIHFCTNVEYLVTELGSSLLPGDIVATTLDDGDIISNFFNQNPALMVDRSNITVKVIDVVNDDSEYDEINFNFRRTYYGNNWIGVLQAYDPGIPVVPKEQNSRGVGIYNFVGMRPNSKGYAITPVTNVDNVIYSNANLNNTNTNINQDWGIAYSDAGKLNGCFDPQAVDFVILAGTKYKFFSANCTNSAIFCYMFVTNPALAIDYSATGIMFDPSTLQLHENAIIGPVEDLDKDARKAGSLVVNSDTFWSYGVVKRAIIAEKLFACFS